MLTTSTSQQYTTDQSTSLGVAEIPIFITCNYWCWNFAYQGKACIEV